MVYKPKDGITLQIAIATGLSVFIIFLLIAVGIDTKNIAERVVETRTEVNTQTKQSREIARLRSEANIAEDKQKKLGTVLPQKDELFLFPNQLVKIGSEESVGINFNFGSEGSSQIGYSLVSQGDYTNIIGFVDVIENDTPFMNITSFNLVFGGGEYTISLDGNVFFDG